MPHPLTAKRLREVLHYDPDTGVFRWRVTLSQRNPAGRIAGCLHKRLGCLYIGVDGVSHKAHRLAWLYMVGRWPEKGIDHIDGDHANNRFANLREATQAENTQNLHAAHRDSSTGLLGVQRRPCGTYFGALCVKGRRFQTEPFPTPEQAHAAYLDLKAKHHPFAAINSQRTA